MKIFYHNDMDGKCAAHIVNSYDDYPTPSSCFHAMQYGMKFPFENIVSGEKIYILDYSIEPEEMKRLLAMTVNVVWIDHHKTAIEKYADFPTAIEGMRSFRFSGCVCTYSYYSKLYPERISAECPEYILLIGDRDTWTWDYGERTKYFFAGLEAYDVHPRAEIWHDLRWHTGMVDVLVSQGEVVQKYKDRTQQEVVRETGFWVAFAGYRCYAICGRFSSQPLEAVVPDADIWLTFRYLHGSWTVSLYSTKVDVSEIAKTFSYKGKRGGGHKGAAGFQCGYPPFLPPPDYERG